MAATPNKESPISSMNGKARPAQSNPSTSTSVPLRSIIPTLFALVTGSLAGAYVISSRLESEYQSSLSKLKSNYQISLAQNQLDFETCHEDLLEEKKAYSIDVANNDDGCQDTLKLVRSQWRHEELSCMQELEREIVYSHKAYEDSTSALSYASDKLNKSREDNKLLKAEVEQTRNELKDVASNLESVTVEMQHARSQLEIAMKQLEESRSELAVLDSEIRRRDIERAECDKTHREMFTCQTSLQKSLEEGAADEVCVSRLASLMKERTELFEQIQFLTAEKTNAVEYTESMKNKVDHLENQLESANELLKEFVRESDNRKAETESILEKVRAKDKMNVLDRYGPGPYNVEITIQLPTNPPQEEQLLIELAPLDLMPHTIKSFLELIEQGIYVDGTLMLAKSHIILVGPVDYHDDENNERLENRLVNYSYSDGILMLNEYTSEYPHLKGTIGFTSSQAGPVFYINTVDNIANHEELKDPCFGRFITGFDLIERIAHMPKTDADGIFELPIYVVKAEVVHMEV